MNNLTNNFKDNIKQRVVTSSYINLVIVLICVIVVDSTLLLPLSTSPIQHPFKHLQALLKNVETWEILPTHTKWAFPKSSLVFSDFFPKGEFKYYISTLGWGGGGVKVIAYFAYLVRVGGLEAKCLCKRSEFLSTCKLLLSL